MARSAGILLYRHSHGALEVLIGHPGGPFWAKKHEGVWSILKGEIDADGDPLAAAVRELAEETGAQVDPRACSPLGEITQKAGKVVAAWACAGEFDPDQLVSNTFELEWPPRSGLRETFPEIDRVQWCSPSEARQLLNPAQVPFVDRLEALLESSEA